MDGCMDGWMDGWMDKWMDGLYLYDIIKLKENTRRLRSSNSVLLSNQKCNLDTYGKRRYSVSAPVLWNNLSLHLQRCNSIKTFKKAVQNYLLCLT